MDWLITIRRTICQVCVFNLPCQSLKINWSVTSSLMWLENIFLFFFNVENGLRGVFYFIFFFFRIYLRGYLTVVWKQMRYLLQQIVCMVRLYWNLYDKFCSCKSKGKISVQKCLKNRLKPSIRRYYSFVDHRKISLFSSEPDGASGCPYPFMSTDKSP